MQVNDDMVDAALDAHHRTSLAISSDPFEAMRAALTAALAHMWRPIEEAPKDRTRVLLYTNELTPPTIQAEWRPYDDQVGFGEWVDVWNNDPIETNVGPASFTHYMPLPAPPETGGE
jgi:hypothetical protein